MCAVLGNSCNGTEDTAGSHEASCSWLQELLASKNEEAERASRKRDRLHAMLQDLGLPSLAQVEQQNWCPSSLEEFTPLCPLCSGPQPGACICSVPSKAS